MITILTSSIVTSTIVTYGLHPIIWQLCYVFSTAIWPNWFQYCTKRTLWNRGRHCGMLSNESYRPSARMLLQAAVYRAFTGIASRPFG